MLEWSINTLGSVADLLQGKAHEKYISEYGAYVVVNSKFVSTQGTIRKYSDHAIMPASKGDILIVLSDVPNGRALAKCYLIPKNGVFTVNQRIGIVRTSSECPTFLSYLLNRNSYFLRFDDGAKQTNLKKQEVLDCPLQLPKLPEQKAIAKALSDTDALITTLEKLIDKKRAIKTATMQQLLTGRTRLPGFGEGKGYKDSELGRIPEDWDVVSLNDAVNFLDSMRKPVKSSDRAKMQGKYPYYGASGIVDYVDSYLFNDDLILLGEDGENIISRSSPLAFRVSGKCWVNNHAHVLKPKPGYNIDFLTEYLESLDYSIHNSGTAQPKLNKQKCASLRVINPAEGEQVAIGSVVTSLTRELSSLNLRLSKTRSIKSAMMQQLLTGRTRLL